jgi:hypothetical protein
MAARYQPPKQSIIGQVFDSLFLMALVFVALWLPLKLGLAGAAKVDWLPGTVTAESPAEGVTVLKNEAGLTKTIGADGKIVFAGLTWEALEQPPEAQAAWQRLWDTQGTQSITGPMGQEPADAMEGAALIITSRYDYSFSWAGLIATLVVVAAYFAFLVTQSDKEYRQVIAERFDRSSR